MKKLLKTYGLSSTIQYYEMITESFTNGQRKQAIEQFRAMPRNERAAMLRAATLSGWDCGISDNDLSILFNNL